MVALLEFGDTFIVNFCRSKSAEAISRLHKIILTRSFGLTPHSSNSPSHPAIPLYRIAMNVVNDCSSSKDLPFGYTANASFTATLITAGVKYLFVNVGTDHPGLIEVFAHVSRPNRQNFPHILTCPNEIVVLTIAHWYAQITGEYQAVLLHIETGTLAMAGVLYNTAKARVPVLIWAGSSPSTIDGE